MTTELKLTIGGMHCSGCVSRVIRALESVDGVVVHEVKVGEARVGYDPAATTAEALAAALRSIGFPASPSPA